MKLHYLKMVRQNGFRNQAGWRSDAEYRRYSSEKPDYAGAALTLIYIASVCLATTVTVTSIWWIPALLEMVQGAALRA